MKKFLLAAASLLSITLCAQVKRCNLTIKTDAKISKHGFPYWQELQIVSKDTSFTYRLHQANPDVIKKLKPGSYQVAAVSLFNHRVSRKVNLKKKGTVKIKGLQSYYKFAGTAASLSGKLKEGDTLYILFSSNASEDLKEKIAITRDKLGYKAIQYKGISNEVFQDMQFRDEYYQQVIKFEKEAAKAHAPKGETAPKAEFYTLVLKREMRTFIVPVEWGGLSNLKALLFLVEK